MDYEYDIITTAFGLGTVRTATTSDAINQHFAPLFGRLGQGLGEGHPRMPGAGWEVVSHSTATVGAFLIVTVLFRRPKQ